MSDPIIRIDMGRHGKPASEIVGLMNVIVNRNNRRENYQNKKHDIHG